jgi:AcrR family transcriptional regulator
MTRHLPEEERRAQILRAARTTFLKQGYLASRMEDVARRAGLSKGALYFYFESKRALLEALVQEERAITQRFLEEAALDPRPAPQKLIDLGRRYLAHAAGLKNPPRFFMLMSEMAMRDEGIREQAQASHERFVQQLDALIDQGRQEGHFRNLDPRAVALVLKAYMDGLAVQSAVGLRPDVGRLAGDGIKLLLDGLLAPRASPAPESGRGSGP